MRQFNITASLLGEAKSSRPHTLYGIIGETDFSDEEFDKLASLGIGEVLELDDGDLRIARIA